jgi:general secretion pathway protein D
MKMINRKYANLFSRVTLILLLILMYVGCASSSAIQRRGMTLFHDGKYDEAVELLEKAVKETPSNTNRTLLFRAKLNSYYTHLATARVLRDSGKKDEAVKQYEIATEIFPNNKKVIAELDELLNGKNEKPPVFKSTITPPIKLNVDALEKMDLKLRSTPLTKIFKVVGKSYNINFIFDKDFRDFVYSIDIENIGFYEILQQLCMIGNAEYRVLDQSSILIYPNTSFKKRSLGLQGVKVFYLSNISAEDAKKLVMALFRTQQVTAQEDKNLNSLIIKGDYNTLVEIEKFIFSIDKRKSELELDVQILEVTRSVIKALGTSYGDPSTAPVSIAMGAVTDDGNGNETITSKNINFNDLGKTNFFLTVPSAALNFLESDDKNRIIAKPNLRGVDGEEIKFMVGDEVPVPQTQFQQAAAGGVANVPVTTYQYKNVGVDVKLTPFMHRDGEVTLKIKMTINSISGYESGFPIFGKRELENIIRLKEGETNIIGGFIKDEVRGSMQGISGLSKLPILGKLFGSTGRQITQKDLVFSITPRIIRYKDITSFDEKTIWSDVQVGPSTGGESSPRTPEAPQAGARPKGDSVVITPSKRRVPLNATSYFTIRVNTGKQLASLSIGGSISGASAKLEEVKTDFFGGQKVDVLKSSSDSSFDLGYSFPEKGRTRVNVVAQLKIKFQEKGNYTISLNSINAVTKERQSVPLNGSTAEIEVY